jgi:hypothetical protein
MTTSSDRNLLYGMLAVQNGFIDRDALHRAMNEWMKNTHRPLGDVLFDQNELSIEERQYLDGLTDSFSQADGGEAIEGNRTAEIGAALAWNGDVDAIGPNVAIADMPRDARADDDGRRFTVLRPHARGGLGQVHVAYDRELHREVALKELLRASNIMTR